MQILKKAQRFVVPLLNGGRRSVKGEFNRLRNTVPSAAQIVAQSNKYAIVKPQRALGGVWIGDKVAHRHPVNLCEFCWRKDYGWWKRCDYKADWDLRWISDCDNCSERTLKCISFYPEENFYKILTSAYGRTPEPNPTIYSA